MNILLQEYGSLILTIVSIILSIVVAMLYAEFIRTNIELINELNGIIKWISSVMV